MNNYEDVLWFKYICSGFFAYIILLEVYELELSTCNSEMHINRVGILRHLDLSFWAHDVRQQIHPAVGI